jgi:anthranilate phosphoribosyltransferase
MSPTEPLVSATNLIRDGNTLGADQISAAMRVIMSGSAGDDLIGDFLETLATRAPTGEELAGACAVMKECVHRVDLPDPDSLLDTCGTGGAPKTFNVSTAAGLVAAACGVRVAKHGNRSRTGRGSSEVLEQLGINIELTTEQQSRCLNEVGICFCFAPKHHKSVAHAMPARKALKTPTIFNLLGPLTNPCSAGRQLLGVWDDVYVEPMAEALLSGGTTFSAVVHSLDGLDEISISAPTRILYVKEGIITEELIEPESLGLAVWDRDEVTATTLDMAVEFFQESIAPGGHGGRRDMVVVNSAVGLFVAGRVGSVREGVELASKTIDSGEVGTLLDRWVGVSNSNIPSTGR